MILDKKQLWDMDIHFPPEILNLKTTGQIFFGETIKIDTDEGLKLPVFLYYETRDSQNYLQCHYVIASGDSNRAIDGMSGGREILSELSQYSIDDNGRGKILNAFCKIDFLLDVMVCIEMGAYEGVIQVKDLNKLLRGRDELFSTTSRKISFLKSKGYISDEAYHMLLKAKQIRNHLAHQYLPNLAFLSDEEIKKHDGWNKLVEGIFNSSWFYLLKDFSKKQLVILNWIAK